MKKRCCIPLAVEACRKAQALPADTHKPDTNLDSLDFKSLVSTSQKPDLYSPAAPDHCAPIADLYTLRCAKSRNNLRLVREAWAGELLECKRQLVIEIKQAGGGVAYYLGGHHFRKSSVIALPVRPIQVPGPLGLRYIEPILDTKGPIVFPLFATDLPHVRATTYTWRSWLWQAGKVPSSSAHLAPSVRPSLDQDFAPLLTVCAQKAFFELSRTFLIDLGKFVGVAVQDGDVLLDTLPLLCQGILGIDERATLDIVHQRLARAGPEGDFTHELLSIDSAIEVLARFDHQKILQEKVAARAEVSQRSAFASTFRERKATAVASSQPKTGEEVRLRIECGLGPGADSAHHPAGGRAPLRAADRFDLARSDEERMERTHRAIPPHFRELGCGRRAAGSSPHSAEVVGDV